MKKVLEGSAVSMFVGNPNEQELVADVQLAKDDLGLSNMHEEAMVRLVISENAGVFENGQRRSGRGVGRHAHTLMAFTAEGARELSQLLARLADEADARNHELTKDEAA